MISIVKRHILVFILVIFIVDLVIGYSLFKSRSFSHLAIWKVIESDRQEDFSWKPEDAPEYYRFDSSNSGMLGFKNEIASFARNEDNQWETVLEVDGYVKKLYSRNIRRGLNLKWDSPERMLKQVKEGANVNCFSRSILFSTYLASVGIKSRLWALENQRFNNVAHTVTEVYLGDLKKWVFIDVTLDFYVTENGNPLSFLELRARLLDGNTAAILAHKINSRTKGAQNEIPVFYGRLVKCVFLRTGNDFVNKYNARYGAFYVFRGQIDRLPGYVRRGVDYLLGRQDIFIHYVDNHSRSLKPEIIIAKLSFYFLIFSLLFIIILSLATLKNCLFRNLSKKDTLQR